MRYHICASLIGFNLLASTATTKAAPAFEQDGWTGFVRNGDLYNGCIMGKHVTNDIYFLIYTNSTKAIYIGVSSPALDKEVDQEIAGTVTFDDNDPLLLTGTVIEADIALFNLSTQQEDLEPLLRKSRQIRMTYDHSKFGLALKGSQNAIDLLRDCANNNARYANTQAKHDSKNLNKKVITGIVKSGRLDSAIAEAGNSYSFMTRSPDGDKIFQACKMDERCKVTALFKPGSDFIETVISAEKLSDAKPLPRQPNTTKPSSSGNQPREIPFFTRGNWGISIVNGGNGTPFCIAWNFPSARYIQNIPQVQDQIQEAMASCKKHITDNPDIFRKPVQ